MSNRALCIGINNYPGTESDLSGCVNDANDWAAELERRGFTVSKLLDRKATGANMRAGIAQLVASAVSGDVVVVQYSGHGSYVPDTDGDEPDGVDEVLCPHDIDSRGPLTDDELYDLFNARKTGVKVVMISDSCHSGSVTRFAPIDTPPTVRGRSAIRRKVKFLPPEAFLSRRDLAILGAKRSYRRASPPGRYASLLMAGCQDTEFSYDAWFNDRPNGAFTFVALRALKTLPRTATYSRWQQVIRRSLPSSQYPQSPNLFGSRSMKAWKVLK